MGGAGRGGGGSRRERVRRVQGAVHFFYENHFGIIGVDETMGVDEMVIF